MYNSLTRTASRSNGEAMLLASLVCARHLAHVAVIVHVQHHDSTRIQAELRDRCAKYQREAAAALVPIQLVGSATIAHDDVQLRWRESTNNLT